VSPPAVPYGVNLTDVKSVRRRSVDAALEILRDDGLEAVTMRAVAERARVTPPAIYWHFADKDALLAEVLREVRALFHDELLDTLAAATAEERLWRSLEAFRRFAVDHPGLFRVLFTGRPSGRQPSDSKGARLTIFQHLVDRVAECMKDGSLRTGDAQAVAMTIAALAQGLVLLYQRRRFRSDTEFARAYRVSFEHLLDGLR
jgi:AcrR family transcriptional regulator